VWIAQGRDAPAGQFLDDALHLLNRLHSAAEADGRIGDMVEIQVLRALALQAQGDLPAAFTMLAGALSLAEPEGYVRIFVDERTPMAALLRTELRGLRTESLPRGYIERLLNAFEQPRAPDPRSAVLSPQSSTLAEPLSERELDVLRLIAEGHSNQAIADRLIVAVSTVKKHVNNIYGKLDVQSRTQALLRARELHLL
jgi:LuxR family transcriptional regulator, maltose regulon positive regulatory protein